MRRRGATNRDRNCANLQPRQQFAGQHTPKASHLEWPEGSQRTHHIAASPGKGAAPHHAKMSTTMMVTIPQGTAPNAVLQVRAPDGRTIKVRVPRNMRPGQQMRISVPTADVDPASEAGDRDARRRQREEAARYRQAAAARDRAPTRSAAVKAAVKAAKVPANPSRGRLPVAGLVGRSFGLYQKDTKAWLALDETKRLVKIDVGHRFSRKSAKKLCEERGGRLAYRREIVDEKTFAATPKLLVNGGKAFGGNKCAPVSLMIDGSGSTPSTQRRDHRSMYTQVDPGTRWRPEQ